MNFVLRSCALALLPLATLAAAAPAAPAPATSAPPPPITGVVTDTAGTPLSNARVVLSGVNRVSMTNSDGSFAFRSVPAGTYHLDASLPGYAPGHVEVRLPATGPDVVVRIELVPTPLALEGVIVTGTAGGADPLMVTQSATQLSGREFDRQVAASVAETLSDEPGISVRYAGPAAALPVIRGLTGERVLMLENGQRTGDLSGASADHGLSVDPLAATRMEVVRGPASLLYGSSALGGVVNVISNDIPTTVPGGIEGYVAAQGVSVTPGGAITAEATLPLASALAMTVRGGFRDVDDVRVGGGGSLEGTGLRNYQGDLGVGYVGERLSGGVAVSAYDFNYGIPGAEEEEEEHEEGEEEHEGEEPGEGIGHGHAGVRLDGRRYELQGRSQLALGGLLEQLDANASAQWYTHDEIEPSGEIGTNFDLRTQTADLRARTTYGATHGAVGVSGLARQYAPTGEEALTPPARSTTAGAFAYQEIPLLPGESELVPHVQVGARYDWYRIRTDASEGFGPERSRDFGAFSGSLGLTFPVGERFSLGGSLARAFRAPTVEELFSNGFHAAAGSFDIGKPDLEPETNLGGEALLRVATPKVNGLFSVYYNRIDDFIAPNLVGDTLVDHEGHADRVPLNIYRQQDATLRGIEAEIEAVVLPRLVVGARGDVVRGRFTDESPLPFMPAGHLGGEVRWDDGATGIGLDVQHTFAQSDVPENELATTSYDLVGLNVSHTRTIGGQVHSVTLRADNLLDVEYREATSRIKEFAPNPGRNISLVYRMVF